MNSNRHNIQSIVTIASHERQKEIFRSLCYRAQRAIPVLEPAW